MSQSLSVSERTTILKAVVWADLYQLKFRPYVSDPVTIIRIMGTPRCINYLSSIMVQPNPCPRELAVPREIKQKAPSQLNIVYFFLLWRIYQGGRGSGQSVHTMSLLFETPRYSS